MLVRFLRTCLLNNPWLQDLWLGRVIQRGDILSFPLQELHNLLMLRKAHPDFCPQNNKMLFFSLEILLIVKPLLFGRKQIVKQKSMIKDSLSLSLSLSYFPYFRTCLWVVTHHFLTKEVGYPNIALSVKSHSVWITKLRNRFATVVNHHASVFCRRKCSR